MNGTNTDILNPFSQMIADAADIRNALREAVGNLELAIEAEAAARRTAKEAKEGYDATEVEFVAETLPACDAKNAEGRKAQLDAALVAARNAGTLAGPWARMNAAAYAWDDAKMALEQAAKRFRATESAADLTAAMLRAATR